MKNLWVRLNTPFEWVNKKVPILFIVIVTAIMITGLLPPPYGTPVMSIIALGVLSFAGEVANIFYKQFIKKCFTQMDEMGVVIEDTQKITRDVIETNKSIAEKYRVLAAKKTQGHCKNIARREKVGVPSKKKMH